MNIIISYLGHFTLILETIERYRERKKKKIFGESPLKLGEEDHFENFGVFVSILLISCILFTLTYISESSKII